MTRSFSAALVVVVVVALVAPVADAQNLTRTQVETLLGPTFSAQLDTFALLVDRTVDELIDAIPAGRCVEFNRTLAADCSLLPIAHTLYENTEINWTQQRLHSDVFVRGGIRYGYGALFRLESLLSFPCRAAATAATCGLYLGCRTLSFGPLSIAVPQLPCRSLCAQWMSVCNATDTALWPSEVFDFARFHCPTDGNFSDAPDCVGDNWVPTNSSWVHAPPLFCAETLRAPETYRECTFDCRYDVYGRSRSSAEAVRIVLAVLGWFNIITLPLFMLIINLASASLARSFRRLITAMAVSVWLMSFACAFIPIFWDDAFCNDEEQATAGDNARCAWQGFWFTLGYVSQVWSIAFLSLSMSVMLTGYMRRPLVRKVHECLLPFMPFVIGLPQALAMTLAYDGDVIQGGVTPMCGFGSRLARPYLIANLVLGGIILLPSLAVFTYMMISVTKSANSGAGSGGNGRTTASARHERRVRQAKRLIPPSLLVVFTLTNYIIFFAVAVHNTSYFDVESNDADIGGGIPINGYTLDLMNDVVTQSLSNVWTMTGDTSWWPMFSVAYILAMLAGPVYLLVYARQIAPVIVAVVLCRPLPDADSMSASVSASGTASSAMSPRSAHSVGRSVGSVGSRASDAGSWTSSTGGGGGGGGGGASTAAAGSRFLSDHGDGATDGGAAGELMHDTTGIDDDDDELSTM